MMKVFKTLIEAQFNFFFMEYYIVPTNLKESSIVLQQYFTIQKRKTNSDILQATHTTSSALLQVLCLSMESEGSHNQEKAQKTNEHELTR